MKKGQKMTLKQKRLICESNRKTWANSDLRKKVSIDRIGDKNWTKRPEVKQKIKNTIKKYWQDGVYDDRINGMLYLGRQSTYKKFLSLFQNTKICYYCKKTASYIHHIDESHENWLPTNLIPICPSCHQKVHRWKKTPFIILSKKFSFCSAHHLIEYTGKCQFHHGHQYFVNIFIKQRINPLTGMVIDYSDLKKMFIKYVFDKVDHKDLNEVTIPKTTVENLLIWIWRQLEEKALIKGLNKIEIYETDTSLAILEIKDVLEWRKNNPTI